MRIEIILAKNVSMAKGVLLIWFMWTLMWIGWNSFSEPNILFAMCSFVIVDLFILMNFKRLIDEKKIKKKIVRR